MVSHDLPLSTVTNQTTYDQRDSNSSHKFERAIDRRCQALVFKLETLVPPLLPIELSNSVFVDIVTTLRRQIFFASSVSLTASFNQISASSL